MSRENYYDYDSPDLWARIKGTRDSVSSTSISNKYRSPGYRPAQRRCAEINTPSPQPNPVRPRQTSKMELSVIRPATEATAVTRETHKAIAKATPMCFTAPRPVVATSCSTIIESKVPSPPENTSKVIVKLPSPSSRLCDTSHVRALKSTPPPYVPPHIRHIQYYTPDQRILPKSNRGLGSGQSNWGDTTHSFPSPIISHTSRTPQRSGHLTLNRNTSSGLPYKLALPGKMSSTDDSDYVVLRDPKVATLPDVQDAPKQTVKETGGGTTPGGSIQQPAGEPSEERKLTRTELRAEIKRLQKEELAKIHQKLGKEEVETADAEVVAKCRDGPGVDPYSEVYRAIEKYRRVRRTEEVDLDVEALSIVDFLNEEQDDDDLDNLEQLSNIDHLILARQWDAYEKQPFIYPKVINEQVTLSPEPSEEQATLRAKFQNWAAHPFSSQHNLPNFPPEAYKLGETFDENCDWWLAPPMLPFQDKWLLKFRRWLDDTISDACYAEIYHEGFFDGTAHPDGIRSFLIPDLPKIPTILDPNDELGRRHRHETAAGLSYNFDMHWKIEAELEEQRLALARQRQMELMATLPPNPNTPKANIYLRPVQLCDVHQLLPIYNWYAANSFVSVDVESLTPGDVQQRIQAARDSRLPFIVAVERGTGQQREAIYGYSIAKDYGGPDTSGKYTVELEVFVHPDQQRKGVGNCLFDKLLHVCDSNHRYKGGYDFNNLGLNCYHLGGRRELARLIVTFTYTPEERQSKSWVRDWLAKHNFELQGRLCGVRAKNGRLLDVAYFVRNNIFPLPYR